MQKIVRLICVADIWLLQTRTPVKEIAFWIGLLGVGGVFIANIFMTSTFEFMGNKLWRSDLIKGNEWAIAAVILAASQLLYIADTFYMVLKKAGSYIDFLTYFNELVFWVIIAIFGFRFSNTNNCSDELNIFPCVRDGEVIDGRWPKFWILPVCKLAINLILFVYCRFVQKRVISHSHGQSIIGLLFDIQYLLVILWIGGYAYKLEAREIIAKRELYQARLVFIVVFSLGMTLPIFAVGCVLLAVYDFERTFWFRAVSRLFAAIWCCLAMAILFVLDGSVGDIDAKYTTDIKVLSIILESIAGGYAIVNCYFKLKTKNTPYVTYDELKTLPIINRMPVLVTSDSLYKSKNTQVDTENFPLGKP